MHFQRFLITTICTICVWISNSCSEVSHADTVKPRNEPVIVELFTSQGCSSCPPADRLLTEFNTFGVNGIEVIGLSMHVDYWNKLGWKDPYSQPFARARQEGYAAGMKKHRIYTPQAVIDGRFELVGHDKSGLSKRILQSARKSKMKVNLQAALDRQANQITVSIQANEIPIDKRAFHILITERIKENAVTRGENSGRMLKHSGVVRSVQYLRVSQNAGKMNTHTITVPVKPSWKIKNLEAVVFCQIAYGPVYCAVKEPVEMK